MYVVLLTQKEDKDVLLSVGWKYNKEKDRFEYIKPVKQTERNKLKYYLTKVEYENIIE